MHDHHDHYSEDKVDINGAFVPDDKYAKDNLSKVSEDIKERFDLEDDEC